MIWSRRNWRGWSATTSSSDHDALGVGAHQDHPAGGPRVDAVAVVIGHDEAGGAGPDRLLDEALERPAQLHQACPLVLEYLPDRPVLELRMLGSPGVGMH